jgi:hypothetical protein
MRDGAQWQCQLGDDMGSRDDLEHRQRGNRRERLGMQVERTRTAPGAFDGDLGQAIAHEFADARRAVDVRDDLQQLARRSEAGGHRIGVEPLVLETHRAGGDAEVAVVQRADQGVLVHAKLRVAQPPRKTPELATRGDRRGWSFKYIECT